MAEKKTKHVGRKASDAQQLQQLKDENRRLKFILAQAGKQLRALSIGRGGRLKLRAFGARGTAGARPLGAGRVGLRIFGAGPRAKNAQGLKLRVWGAAPRRTRRIA